VSLYSLFFVKGIDSGLSRMREERRYSSYWDEVKALIRRVNTLCDVFARQHISLGLGGEELEQIAQDVQDCLARLKAIQSSFDRDEEMAQVVSELLEVDLSPELLIRGERAKARESMGQVKEALERLDEVFAAAIHRRRTGW
jgi:hypothetical protein